MEKFSNVDILAALDAIMRQNTGFYQDQFQNDRQTITEAAASPAKDDKTLLWVSAPAGTCCETEKDLLIRENVEYGRFRVFAEGVRLDGDKALCYAVKITGAEGGKITGDLYRLDYLEQLARRLCHLHRQGRGGPPFPLQGVPGKRTAHKAALRAVPLLRL